MRTRPATGLDGLVNCYASAPEPAGRRRISARRLAAPVLLAGVGMASATGVAAAEEGAAEEGRICAQQWPHSYYCENGLEMPEPEVTVDGDTYRYDYVEPDEIETQAPELWATLTPEQKAGIARYIERKRESGEGQRQLPGDPDGDGTDPRVPPADSPGNGREDHGCFPQLEVCDFDTGWSPGPDVPQTPPVPTVPETPGWEWFPELRVPEIPEVPGIRDEYRWTFDDAWTPPGGPGEWWSDRVGRDLAERFVPQDDPAGTARWERGSDRSEWFLPRDVAAIVGDYT